MNFFKKLFKKREQPKRVKETKNTQTNPFHSVDSSTTNSSSQPSETNNWVSPFADPPFSFNNPWEGIVIEDSAQANNNSFGGFGGGDGDGGGAGGSWDTDTSWDTSSNDSTSTNFD